MKKRLLTSGLLLCGALSCGVVSAQQAGMSDRQMVADQNSRPRSDSALSLNLVEAIEIALNDNPTIKIAGMEIQRQEYVRKETVGNLMPNVSASGSYNYNIMNQVMFMPEGIFGPGTGGAMRMGFRNSFTGGVSLSLPLYMPTIYKTLQINEQQMLAAVEAARGSKITLVNQVKKTYFGILMSENSLEVIKDNIVLAEKIVNDTRHAYDQGTVSEYDLITAQVQLSNLQPTLLDAENVLRNAKLMFNMLLNLPSRTALVFEQTLLDYEAIALHAIDSTEIDLGANSDLKQLDLQRQILNKQLQLQKAARIPTLSAVAQYQVMSQNDHLRLGEYDWRGTALAGLQLQIPIFAGLSKINKERQVKNNIDQLGLQHDYLTQTLDVEARTAQSNMLKATEQTITTRGALAMAEKGYQIAHTRYEVGAGTITELNSAQVSQLQAQLQHLQAIYDFMSAKADYEKILGQIN